jgi:hypothetical protein
MMAWENLSEIVFFLTQITVWQRNYTNDIEYFQYYVQLGTFCSEAVLLLMYKDI